MQTIGTTLRVSINSVRDVSQTRQLTSGATNQTDSVEVDYDIYVPNAVEIGYSSALEAYEGLKMTFENATETGEVTLTLQKNAQKRNATAMENTNSDTVIFNDPEYPTIQPTNPPAEGSSSGSGSTSPIYGLTLAQFLFLFMVFGMCFCFFGGLFAIKIRDRIDKERLFADTWPAVHMIAEPPQSLMRVTSAKFDHMRRTASTRIESVNPMRSNGNSLAGGSTNLNPLMQNNAGNANIEGRNSSVEIAAKGSVRADANTLLAPRRLSKA